MKESHIQNAALNEPVMTIRSDGSLITSGVLNMQSLVLNVPAATHWLVIAPQVRIAQSQLPKPFHRLMMRLAFGWRWEKMP